MYFLTPLPQDSNEPPPYISLFYFILFYFILFYFILFYFILSYLINNPIDPSCVTDTTGCGIYPNIML